MNILQFLFRLILNNVQVDKNEFANTMKEIEMDYAKIQILPSETLGEPKKDWKYYMKFYAENPYCKLALAVLFIFAQRWVSEFMNPIPETAENED